MKYPQSVLATSSCTAHGSKPFTCTPQISDTVTLISLIFILEPNYFYFKGQENTADSYFE